MKINLLIDSDKTLQGYLNIDPFTKDGDNSKVKGNVHDLDELVDDNEAMEIRAVKVLEFFAHVDSPVVAENWIKKLHHGGKLIIGTLDVYELARGINHFEIDIDQANLLLYGNQKHPWTFHKAGFTTPQLVAYLESKGLKVIKKRIEDYYCVVEAIRE